MVEIDGSKRRFTAMNLCGYEATYEVTSTRPMSDYELGTRTPEQRIGDLLEELVEAVKELTEAVKNLVPDLLTQKVSGTFTDWYSIGEVYDDEITGGDPPMP